MKENELSYKHECFTEILSTHAYEDHDCVQKTGSVDVDLRWTERERKREREGKFRAKL